MEIFPGIPTIGLDISAVSIFSDVIVNKPLPDSVYNKDAFSTKIYDSVTNTTKTKTNEVNIYDEDDRTLLTFVHPNADSTKLEY